MGGGGGGGVMVLASWKLALWSNVKCRVVSCFVQKPFGIAVLWHIYRLSGIIVKSGLEQGMKSKSKGMRVSYFCCPLGD